MDGGQAGGVPFEHRTQLEDLIHLGAAELEHEGAAARFGAHQTVGGEPSEAGAHRCARHADALGHVLLDQALAWTAFTVQDPLPDGVVGQGACAGHPVQCR